MLSVEDGQDHTVRLVDSCYLHLSCSQSQG